MFTVLEANNKWQILLEFLCLIAFINITLWVRKWKTVVRLCSGLGSLRTTLIVFFKTFLIFWEDWWNSLKEDKESNLPLSFVKGIPVELCMRDTSPSVCSYLRGLLSDFMSLGKFCLKSVYKPYLDVSGNFNVYLKVECLFILMVLRQKKVYAWLSVHSLNCHVIQNEEC